jgi:hypothetical protein
MLQRLPEPVRHPSVARAAVSPSAIVLTGGGVAIGAAEHSIVLAVVLGVVGWSARMVAAVVRSARRRAARPRPEIIDPWAVPEPWRQFVRQAVDTQTRYDQLVGQRAAGPLQDRLVLLRPRVEQAVHEVWALAGQGAAMGGPTVAGTGPRPSVAQLSAEMARVQSERHRLGSIEDAGAPPGRGASLDRAEEALAAQLAARRQAEDAVQLLTDRLRLLTARLDAAVSSLASLAVAGGDLGATEQVVGAVDALVEEIGSLRRGMDEAAAPSGYPEGAAAAGAAAPPTLPPRS